MVSERKMCSYGQTTAYKTPKDRFNAFKGDYFWVNIN